MARVLNKRTDKIPPDAVYVGRPSSLKVICGIYQSLWVISHKTYRFITTITKSAPKFSCAVRMVIAKSFRIATNLAIGQQNKTTIFPVGSFVKLGSVVGFCAASKLSHSSAQCVNSPTNGACGSFRDKVYTIYA